MTKKVNKKKVSFIVGASLDGPIYCEHDVFEQKDAKKDPSHACKKTDLRKGEKPVPRPNRRG